MMLSTDSRLFRIFVSSTFEDFIAEREVLRTKVFDPMAVELSERGFMLQIVDLRWGVGEEETLGHETIRICRDQIQLCQKYSPRPNFIILAGDRYGWRPAPAAIAKGDFNALCAALQAGDRATLQDWYVEDKNVSNEDESTDAFVLKHRGERYLDSKCWDNKAAELNEIIDHALSGIPPDVIPQDRRSRYQNSATEQEVERGFIQSCGAETHTFAVLRSIKNLSDVAADDNNRKVLRPYLDWKRNKDHDTWDEDTWQRQDRLKKRIAERFGANYRERVFNCGWRLEQGAIIRDYLTDTTLPVPEAALTLQPRAPEETTLQEAVWRGLWQVLLPEIEAREAARSGSKPGERHGAIAKRRSEQGRGREADLARLSQLVESSQGQPIIVYGPSGVGKSTILSMLAEKMRNSWKVVIRFIGANETTNNAITLLDGLAPDISLSDTHAEPPGIGDPLSVSASTFLRELRAHRTIPLLIVLDALDQLPSADIERIPDWLPRHLPSKVKLVLSTTAKGKVIDLLRGMWPEEQASGAYFELKGLDESGAEKMLDAVLAENNRRLQCEQRKAVLEAFVAPRLPLWLDLTGRQALRWASFQEPPKLASSTEELIADWFSNIAQRAGPRLVSRILDFLAASRRGMTEKALWELCSAEADIQQEFLRATYHVPQEILDHIWPDGNTDPREQLVELQKDPAALASAAHRLVGAKVPLPLTLWIRVREDLMIYLTDRQTLGSVVIDFHHAAVRRVAEAQSKNKTEVHQRIVDYLEPRWRQNDPLVLDGLAWHLACAQDASRFADLLIDPDWHVSMLRHVGIGSLQEAFTWCAQAGLDASRQQDLAWIAQAIAASAHVVSGQSRSKDSVGAAPELLPGQLLGRLRGHQGPLIDCFLERLERWHGFNQSAGTTQAQLYPVTPSLPALSLQLQRTIAGHARPVVAVLVHPDGRTGISCDDWCILVWDLNSGVGRLRKQVFDKDGVGLQALALWPDTDSVVAAASDGKFWQYDIASGLLSEWQAHQPADVRFAASASGVLISAVADREVKVWHQPKVSEHLFQSHQLPTAFAMDTKQPIAAIGFEDGGLAVWDLANKSHRGGKAPHRITALVIDASSERVWWGADDGGVGIWAYRRSEPESWERRHYAKVTGLAIVGREVVISVSYDMAIRFWSACTGAAAERWPESALPQPATASLPPTTPVGHCFRLTSVAAAPDRPLFATGSEDTTVRIWDANAAVAVPARFGHRSSIVDTAIDRKRQRVFTVSKDAAIECWDLLTGQHLFALGHHPTNGIKWQTGDPKDSPPLCSRILLTADENYVVTAGAGQMCRWDLSDKSVDRVKLPGNGRVSDLVWSHDGAMFLSLDEQLYDGDKCKGQWCQRLYYYAVDAREGEFKRLYAVPDGTSRIAVSPDRKMLAVVWREQVFLGQLVGDTLKCDNQPLSVKGVTAVTFLPDQDSILIVGHDRQVRLWSFAGSVYEKCVIGRHEREIWDVAVSADGKVAATVGDDRWAALWNITARRLRACFRAEGPMVRLSLDPAGEFIATGDEAGRPIILQYRHASLQSHSGSS